MAQAEVADFVVKLSPGQNQIRVRIEGSYRGRRFSYEDPRGADGSQFLWGSDDGTIEDTSFAWWSTGNFSCDCNRSEFLPSEWGVGEECEDEIMIDRVMPLVEGCPGSWILNLHETPVHPPV